MSSDSRLANEDALLAPHAGDAEGRTVRLSVTAPNEALAPLTLARLLALWQVNSQQMAVEWPFCTTPTERRPNATASADLAIIKGTLFAPGAGPKSEIAGLAGNTVRSCRAAERRRGIGPDKRAGVRPAGRLGSLSGKDRCGRGGCRDTNVRREHDLVGRAHDPDCVRAGSFVGSRGTDRGHASSDAHWSNRGR